MQRRDFMKSSALTVAGLSLFPAACASGDSGADTGSSAGIASVNAGSGLLFTISLAQWSLHRMLRAEEITNLDFPVYTKNTWGIDAVEYVNSFMREESRDPAYVAELKRITESEGIRNVLIMCDGEGRLGDSDDAARTQAIENHYRWIDISRELGCHSIRVNAASEGDWNTQRDLAADGLRRLTEYGEQASINVIVENHGGISSNGAWLAEVMKTVDHPMCGTLPDFGNFNMGEAWGGWYDIYQGTEELMPFAKAVSAKSHNFDADGNERDKDYMRLMRTVLDAGYRGYVGIEYEGGEMSEKDGVQATLDLLLRCRETLTPEYS
ncbi:MAG: sugar phosphate isomerase/epimerase [Bacteroidota bacterium]|nr:sugar phosphate isomerase/epimerase [Bacteroidota bacterium]